jgi:hypothetical protein
MSLSTVALTTPEEFQELLDVMKNAFDRAAQIALDSPAGKYSFIHIDGTMAGLLNQEVSVGFSVLEALTPHPVGDL